MEKLKSFSELFDETGLEKGLINSGSGLEVSFGVVLGTDFEDLTLGMMTLSIFFSEGLD